MQAEMAGARSDTDDCTVLYVLNNVNHSSQCAWFDKYLQHLCRLQGV